MPSDAALSRAPASRAPAGLHVMTAVVLGAVVMAAAMGARQSFGLFLGPLADLPGLSLSLASFALALHNLAWGFAQPFAGAAADRFGAPAVTAIGAALYAAGLLAAAFAPGPAAAMGGLGVLVGIGLACTSFGIVLPAAGRAVPPERRSSAMGVASAVGAAGAVAIVPLVQAALAWGGAMAGLLVLAALVLASAPFGLALRGGGGAGGAAGAVPPSPGTAAPSPPLSEVLRGAARHRGFRLLTLGFLACGFQLAFIAIHLPQYLALCGMAAAVGATALALISLANVLGSWLCGWAGSRWRPQRVLGWIYLARAGLIVALLALPPSPAMALLFAAGMGVIWLGTVPVTNALIARMLGARHLGTLFGLCFLSHQVGSFLGAALGGVLLEATGSYATVWALTAIVGLAAALLHFAIDDAPSAAASRALA